MPAAMALVAAVAGDWPVLLMPSVETSIILRNPSIEIVGRSVAAFAMASPMAVLVPSFGIVAMAAVRAVRSAADAITRSANWTTTLVEKLITSIATLPSELRRRWPRDSRTHLFSIIYIMRQMDVSAI